MGRITSHDGGQFASFGDAKETDYAALSAAAYGFDEGVKKGRKDAEAELVETRRRAKRAEQLSEARFLALKQYVAHHSSCGECYKVWTDVQVALAADQPAEAGGEE